MPVVNIPAEKVVQAADGSHYELPAGAFYFQLTPAAVNPAADPVKGPILLTNEANGAIKVLTDVTYTEAGTYYYVLEERFRPIPGMQFTDRGFLIVVRVEEAGGALQAAISVINEEGEEVGLDGLRFLNIYDPGDILVVIPGTKVLEGDLLETGEFTFQIRPVSATVEELPTMPADLAEIPESIFGVPSDSCPTTAPTCPVSLRTTEKF